MRDRHVAGVTEIMRPPGSAKPGDARTVLAIIGVLLIPACITLASVRHPAGRGPGAGEASPLGYTWSLSFALVPVVAILAATGARRRRRMAGTVYHFRRQRAPPGSDFGLQASGSSWVRGLKPGA